MHALIVVAALLMGSAAQAQDTLHLTDGTEARGTILAWSPSEGVTLKRPDGVVSIYPTALVARVSRGAWGPEMTSPVVQELPEVHGRPHPWEAFGLSVLVPGAGQLYNGQPGKGVASLGYWLFGLACYWPALDGKDGARQSRRVAIGSVFIVGSHAFSLIDATVSAERIQKKLGSAKLSIGGAPKGVRLAVRF